MKIEKQVCGLKFAKKLKELGVKQESVWYWTQTFNPKRKPHPYQFEIQGCGRADTHHKYSAFTVAELGEMLPQGYSSWNNEHTSSCESNDEDFLIKHTTEANVRAKMLIYLLENKLMLQEAE